MPSPILTIDGSMGEGGGQVLRSALSLSLCSQRPFRMLNIRRGRQRPGLRAQHLAAVTAAAAISNAEVKGDKLKSQQLEFFPQPIKPGHYEFDIGTAGSTSLVIQTLLPALLTADAPSQLMLHGGTHNPLAPTFEFLQQVFAPLLSKMGARVNLTLLQAGFYPAGGGSVKVQIEPVRDLQPLTLEARQGTEQITAHALLARLPEHIAERELATLGKVLGIKPENRHIEFISDGAGPGNALLVSVHSDNIVELFSGIGIKGLRAETVSMRLAAEVQRYLASPAAVGKYLADQLLIPLWLAGGGSFRTLQPSRHTLTNIEVLHQFVDGQFICEELGQDDWRIRFNA